jgi:hypothetical protein
MGKLTKHFVEIMKLPSSRQTFLWDDELCGFGIRAIASGPKC